MPDSPQESVATEGANPRLLFERATENADSAVPAPPSWMKSAAGKRPGGQAGAVRPRSAVITPSAEEVDSAKSVPLRIRIQSWLQSAAAAGYGLSLLVHALLLFGMALCILPYVV